MRLSGKNGIDNTNMIRIKRLRGGCQILHVWTKHVFFGMFPQLVFGGENRICKTTFGDAG